MTFNDFLNMCRVIRMLWGVKKGREFFLKNITEYTMIDTTSLTNDQE